MTSSEIIIQLVFSILFAGAGVLISRTLPNPGSLMAWVVLVLGILLAANILPIVIGTTVGQFGLYMGSSLHGLGIGILFGFILRKDQFLRKP
jgi:uncharacterized membrane protein AbrB (regulator of aidB expression)